MEAPFYFIAHALAPKLNYERDGFSKPYQSCFLLAHFFYIILGFILLRKALLFLFEDKLVSFLLLILFLGTNYTVTAVLTPGMPHAAEFALFSFILYLTIVWHKASNHRIAALMGIAIGLVVLVRPTDGVIILVPLLWNVSGLKSLKEKVRDLFKNHKTDLLLIIFFCGALGFLQMFYWKQVAGKWLLMSYSNNPGEGFEFFSPYIFEVLFSFRKGWLLYTPMMLFALAGFRQMYKYERKIFWPVLLFFIFNLYIVASWSCWWYAESFGQRALVDSYAIMLLPMGYFFKHVFSSASRIFKTIILFITSFFILLNLFQTWQYTNYIIDGSRMTGSYYAAIFGKTAADENTKQLLLLDRSKNTFNEDEYVKKELLEENFEGPEKINNARYTNTLSHSGKYSIQLDSLFSKNNKFETAYKQITEKGHAWVRTSFWYYMAAEQDSFQFVITFINYKGWPYKHTPEIIKNGKDLKVGHWNKFIFDYLTPEVRSTDDKINIYFWPYGRPSIFIDDIKVEIFEKRE